MDNVLKTCIYVLNKVNKKFFKKQFCIHVLKKSEQKIF